MRRLLALGQLLASIALILVVLSVRSRTALVGIFHIGTVVLWRNFIGHFDLHWKLAISQLEPLIGPIPSGFPLKPVTMVVR